MTANIVFYGSKPPHPKDAETLKARRTKTNRTKRAVVTEEAKKVSVVRYK